MITLRFDNLAEVDQLLSSLPVELRRSAYERGLRDAAGLVVRRARELCPPSGYPGDKPGLKALRETIGYVLRAYGDIYVAVVGPQRPAGAHGHLVEYGTKPHDLIASAYASRAPRATGVRRQQMIDRYTSMTRKKAIAANGVIYGQRARHPGATPAPFMGPAAEDTRSAQERRIVEAISRAIAKLTGGAARLAA